MSLNSVIALPFTLAQYLQVINAQHANSKLLFYLAFKSILSLPHKFQIWLHAIPDNLIFTHLKRTVHMPQQHSAVNII